MDFAAYRERIENDAGNRYDISKLFLDPAVFDALVADLTDPFRDADVDLVAGLDATGFVLGTAVARELGVGFLTVRKGGKLPIPDDRRLQRTLTDYTKSTKRLELDRTSVPDGTKVLLVDDWVETAAQMTAAVELVEAAGGVVVGIVTIGTDDAPNDAVERLRKKYTFHSLDA